MSTIAVKAGCSVTTVSRVMSGQAGKYRISKATAEKILKVLKDVEYYPVKSPRKLHRLYDRTIGLLIPSVANPYFAEMASVIISEASAGGYAVAVMDAREDESLFAMQLKLMESRSVAGIIAIPCGDDAVLLEKVSKRIPVVLVDRYLKDTTIPYVTSNNYQGGFEATRILVKAGYRRIAAIQGPTTSMPSADRIKGYSDAMADAGLSEYVSIAGDEFSVQCGYRETRLLLERDTRPEALFTLSNTIMLGTVKAIREAGLVIPDDIGIITFDNNEFMNYMNPAISRIGQPVSDMARLAVKILQDRIVNPDSPVSQIKLSPTYLAGESI